MLTKKQRYIVVGLLAQLLHQRATLDEAEEFAADIIRSLGAKDEGTFHSVLDEVREIVYNDNESDDPEKAADKLLEVLKLEVKDD